MGFIVKLEKFIFKQCDEIIVLSDKDSELIKNLYDINHIKVRPYIPPKWTTKVSRISYNKNVFVFFGNFNRQENLEALIWFLEEIFNELINKFPTFKWQVIGEVNVDEVRLRKYNKSVEFLGFLDDPSTIFSGCSASIAPLKYGAGIKYKVLDSLAAGVPIIGTSVAFEGIELDKKTILAEREGFLEAIIKHLST